MTNRVPELRHVLPLIYQTRRIAFKEIVDFGIRHPQILIAFVRIVHVQCASTMLFASRGFAAPLRTLEQNCADRFESFGQDVVKHSFSIIFHRCADYSRFTPLLSIAIRQFGSFSFGSLARFRSAVWLVSFLEKIAIPLFAFAAGRLGGLEIGRKLQERLRNSKAPYLQVAKAIHVSLPIPPLARNANLRRPPGTPCVLGFGNNQDKMGTFLMPSVAFAAGRLGDQEFRRRL